MTLVERPAAARPAARAARRLERIARVATGLVLLGVPAALLASRAGDLSSSSRVVDLLARQPAAGGWSLERIVVNRGERVRLRIRSEDVVHGFAIAGLGIDVPAIEPGKTTVVELEAARAGEFTFYCTVWCDPSHPRMRGVIEVRDPAAMPGTATPPRDVAVPHADMPHPARSVPATRPSAASGERVWRMRCAACHGRDGERTTGSVAVGRRQWLQERSPAEVFETLAGSPAGHRGSIDRLSAQDRWDTVAYLWSLATTPERLDLGRRLYARNCAGCHGETGAGDGPGGRGQPKPPANFVQARTMLGGTGAVYTAKIRRGGMGTGMPYWGSIFTEEELAALVDYLWTFCLGIDDRGRTGLGEHRET